MNLKDAAVGLCSLLLATADTAVVRQEYSVRSPPPPGSAQFGAKPARCHTDLAVEYRGEMALVAEPRLVQSGEGLVCPAEQGFCALDPALQRCGPTQPRPACLKPFLHGLIATPLLQSGSSLSPVETARHYPMCFLRVPGRLSK